MHKNSILKGDLMKILLINGWGGLLESLKPLQQRLQADSFVVDIMDYVNVLDTQVLHDMSDKLVPYDVVAGWSLGGQVATVLLHDYYVRNSQAPAKILWTLFSNPCFMVHKNWKYAQAEYEVLDFETAFIANPKITLHRFLRNILSGQNVNRTEYQKFVQHQNEYYHQQGAYQHLVMGLDLLKNLDNLTRLKQLDERGIQHICFLAKQDNLAPHQLSIPLMKFGSNQHLILEYLAFEHHFSIYSQVEQVAQQFKICLTSSYK